MNDQWYLQNDEMTSIQHSMVLLSCQTSHFFGTLLSKTNFAMLLALISTAGRGIGLVVDHDLCSPSKSKSLMLRRLSTSDTRTIATIYFGIVLL